MQISEVKHQFMEQIAQKRYNFMGQHPTIFRKIL